MKKKLIALTGFAMGFATPLLALAQGTGAVRTGGAPTVCTGGAVTTFQGMLCKTAELLNAVIPILIALGVVYFVWGVVQYVIANDEEAKKAGRDRVIFGIIGLAIIISVWGLAKLLGNTFGLNQNVQDINFPTVPY